MKRTYVLALTALIALFLTFNKADAATGGSTDLKKAEEIGRLLDLRFAPQSLSVTTDKDRAFVVMGGARLGGIRIDEMRLDARLKRGQGVTGSNLEEISELIEDSTGEIIMLESDVNDYYKKGADTSGFSELVFDFKPKGFQAKGIFFAQMLLNLKLNLEAVGNLALKSDGVYIDNVSIYAEGIKQPDIIVSLITDKINPLLSFSDIPFPVRFNSIRMTDKAIVLTGITQKAPKSSATWNKR